MPDVGPASRGAHLCDVVVPCRDESAALVHLLPRVPADFRVIVDGDGSTDPAVLPQLDDVRTGFADLAVGRRVPVGRGVWPWHARAGNALVVVGWLRRRHGFPVRDTAPVRVCHLRAAGTRSTVSGSVRGTLRAVREFWRVLHR